jgi:hypothetical protein
LHIAANNNVLLHLKKLEKEGIVKRTQKESPPSSSKPSAQNLSTQGQPSQHQHSHPENESPFESLDNVYWQIIRPAHFRIFMEVFPRYRGKEIKATKAAAEEMWQHTNDLWDVVEIVEHGYPCGRSRREANIVENCVRHRGKIHKAVVADCGDYWLVIHYGMFSYKKR